MRATTKNSLAPPKFFWVLVAAGLLSATAANNGTDDWAKLLRQRLLLLLARPVPQVVVDSQLTDAQKAFRQAASSLKPEELSQLGDFYAGLARSVRSDPPAEPVMPTTDSVRAAHRAGLLFMLRWLNAQSNPTLQASIEGVLTEAIGRDSVPLNPALRQSAGECFERMAQICTSANR